MDQEQEEVATQGRFQQYYIEKHQMQYHFYDDISTGVHAGSLKIGRSLCQTATSTSF